MVEVSPREAEVLSLVGQHLTNSEIAARLYISVRTVESHVSSLLRKVGVDDRRALAAYAAQTVEPTTTSSEASGLRGAPVAFTSFVGRQADLESVTGALGQSRLVTLTGPGGIGKTRLAIEAGTRVATPRAWFVDLVPATSESVVEALAATLEVSDRPNRSLVQVVCDSLVDQPGLVVLDNCEHVLDAVAGTAERLLRWCPDVRVLATSREPLGLPGERVLPVRPLAADGRDGTGDAVTLLRERAVAAGAVLAPDDDGALREICSRLDGLPLAIELAAARCAALGVDGVRRGLDDRFVMLRGNRGGDERHRSLRAVLDWSFGLLDADEQTVLTRAAVFQGGFCIVDAEAVAAGPLSPATVVDALGRLVDKSLVARIDGPDGPRFRLLETVRAYAAERLAQAGGHDDAADAHLAWAVAEAATLERALVADDALPPTYDLVVDDLRTALHWAQHRGSNAVGHELARAMAHLAYGRRFFGEARLRYEEAARFAADDGEAADDLLCAGHAAFALLQGDIGYERFVTAAERATRAGDRATAALALGLAVERANRMPAEFPQVPAPAVLDEHLTAAHRLGDDLGPMVHAQLAVADAWRLVECRPSATRADAESAVAAARAAGDPVTESSALDALAAALWEDGELAGSAVICRERADLLQRLDWHDPRAGSEVIDILHMACDGPLAIGDLATATAFAEWAIGHPMAVGALHVLQRELVIGYCLTGRFAEGLAHGELMRTAWQRIGEPTAGWMAPATYLVAMAHALLGRAALSDEWMALSDQVSLEARHAMRGFVTVRVALHQGRLDDGLDHVRRHLADTEADESVGAWPVSTVGYAPYLWALVADLWAARGAPDAAARIAEVREATRQHLWAGPCLQRAEGRVSGDPEQLRAAAQGFGAIGARFEEAVTLALLDGTEAEQGRHALADMGCQPERA